MRELRNFIEFLIFYFMVVTPLLCNCDIFNSQVELETLFELRKSASEGIEEYLRLEEMRLELVKEKFLISSGLSRVGDKKKTISVEENKFLVANPINAFLAIKGLSLDLADVLKPAFDRTNSKALGKLMEDLMKSKKFPDDKDLKGAAAALTRLQNTYLLKTEVMSKGCIQDDFCSIDLSVDDCFEVGKQSYQERDYSYAIQWFTEALRKLEEEEKFLTRRKNETGLSPAEILTQLTKSIKRRTKKSEILEYLNWAQEIKNTLNIGKQFLSELTGIEMDAFIDEVVKAAENHPTEGEAEDNYSTVLKKYEALCRGEGRIKQSQNPNLKCTYSTRNNNPYFALRRVKEEQVHLEPPVWVFHDVIYDYEIEIIKKIAIPLFKTATVVNSYSGGTEQSATRVSKSAWLINSDDQVVVNVNKRIKELTNLDIRSSEDLQVANYGIGGMYLPHYDFSHTAETIRFLPKEEGNRIATLMFYMSDVRLGGATAFPHLNLSIWPEKGAAAFWYNLKADGRGDFRTQHGACPVIIGDKWVSNKWIHERKQEFLRPCDLHKNGPKRK